MKRSLVSVFSVFLSTPSARRATHALNAEVLEQQFLSMPSARRATRCPCISPSPTHGFLSTPSARRATMPRGTTPAPPTNFYPRPPRGGRPRCFFVFAQSFVISIHALREEGDAADPLCGLPLLYFYPRPPRGGRPSRPDIAAGRWKFLSTPSARRATKSRNQRGTVLSISIHALREKGDVCRRNGGGRPGRFLSTPSARRATPINEI